MKVLQGSLRFFLRISLAGQFPQGSARFREGSAGFRRVPQGSASFRNGFLKRFPLDSLYGSLRVPRRFREGSARFREGSADFFRAVFKFIFFLRFLKDS